jgi:hypothetical protein
MTNASTKIKYPRTVHLPWSPGVGGDDSVAADVAAFVGERVVVTEKMDGENTSIYRDDVHARSLDTAPHPSRAWVRSFQATIGHELPDGWRICGENLFARHSLGYDALESYFLAFSVWDSPRTALSWDDTVAYCAMLGVATVPVLYDGPWDEARVRALAVDTSVMEGYVVRVARAFTLDEFARAVAKWVRPQHVQTDRHWLAQAVVPNGLARGKGTK